MYVCPLPEHDEQAEHAPQVAHEQGQAQYPAPRPQEVLLAHHWMQEGGEGGQNEEEGEGQNEEEGEG